MFTMSRFYFCSFISKRLRRQVNFSSTNYYNSCVIQSLGFLLKPCKNLPIIKILAVPTIVLISFFSFLLSGKGIVHMMLFKKYVFFCPMRCCSFLRQKVAHLKNKAVTRTGTSDELLSLNEDSDQYFLEPFTIRDQSLFVVQGKRG